MTENSQTLRAVLDSKHIAEAELRAQDRTPNKKLFTYSDDRLTGLQIRCQGKQAFWNLRYKDWSKTIGYVFPDTKRFVGTITEARDIGQAAKEILDDNPDMLEPFLVKYFAIRSSYPKKTAEGVKAARAEMRAKPTTWTLRQCLEFVIEYRQSAVCPIKERVGKYAVAEWSLTLRREALRDLLDKPVVLLNQGHFNDPREQITKEFGIDPANKAISNIRSCLDYCMRKRSLETGLSQKDQWWLLIEDAGEKERHTRTPTVEDVVRTLILAEEYLVKPLPGRTDGKHGVRPNVLAALWWLVLTAQRTYAGLHIRHIDFFPDDERPGSGWYLAKWQKDVMKASKTHIIPIPPRVVALITPLIEAIKNEHRTEWLFPSERGDEGDDITVGKDSVRLLLKRLNATDDLSKDDEGNRRPGFVDFFELLGIPWWTPHDLRRTIGVELDKANIPGGHSAILAHKIEMPKDGSVDKARKDWAMLYTQEVTRQAYHDPIMMDLKSRAMSVWTDRVLDLYEELSPTAQARKAEHERIEMLRYIYRDAADVESTIEPARLYAEQKIAKQRAVVEQRERTMQSFLADESVNFSAVAFAKEMLAEAEDELDRLSTAALIEGSEQARGNSSLFKIINEDRFDFDYKNKAPDWIAIRNEYVLGRITLEELKAKVAEVYGLDFSPGSAGIFLPDRGPSTLWEGTVSREEELAMRAEERRAMGLQ